MPSKTSSIKKQIILHDVRQAGWLSVLYFLALLLILPIQIIIQYSNPQAQEYMEKGNLFLYIPEVQWLLSITVPVLLGILLLRYLHKKQVSDFIHSMPVKRSSLYHHHLVVGMVLLFIPIMLNALILLGLQAFSGIGDYFNIMHVFSWLGIMLFLNIFMLLATFFTGMVTGMFSMHFVLTYILVLLPAGLVLLLIANMSILFVGYPMEYYADMAIFKFSPISYFLINFTPDPELSWIVMSLYAAAGILLYLAAFWLYANRRMEATSQAIVYPFMRPVFRYGVTFCFMMVGGYYFHAISSSFAWVIFGYVAGSLLGFIVAEAILNKTWRIYSNYKSYLVFAVSLAVVLIAVNLVKENYENKIPSPENIVKVYFGDSYTYTEAPEYLEAGIKPLFFTDKQDVELVRDLHEQAIEAPRADNYYEGELRSTFIVYELKNGKKVARSYTYSLDDNPELKSLQYEIEGSNAYKYANNAVFNIAPNEIYAVDVQSNDIKQSSARISDPELINALIEAIKKDIELEDPQADSEELLTYSLDLLTNKDQGYYYASFDDSDKNTIQVLQDAGLYDDLKVYSEDISRIDLENFERNNTVTVEDPEEIKQILNHVTYYSEEEDSYFVTFNLNRGRSTGEEMSIEYEDLPESIKNQLEE
ncbi:ABC-2 type transport system permease protein [Terribacillus saccharophilus]|uniref:ABC-2 type transport system permease protein n=1 Tax=Terribacillus saccharophilus TaxID=361277 RepID=A0AAX2EI21_9BACI|nr:ABC-2 type transport system permease protein [Terribacillus saccharophilus]